MTAAEFIRSKAILPSEMRTRQWARVPLWIKEQSFFMAGVTDAVMLSAFQEAAGDIASGRKSEQEALRTIREALKATGYKAEDGQEGTIKDLSTVRRQLVSLRAQAGLAAGWAREQEQLDAAIAYPAKELYRQRGAKVPRRWREKIWPETAKKRNAAHPDLRPLREDLMMAPLGDPVWPMLSDFGAPYDPLKYSTGMRQRPVGYSVAEAAGIMGGNPDRVLPRKLKPAETPWLKQPEADATTAPVPAPAPQPGPQKPGNIIPNVIPAPIPPPPAAAVPRRPVVTSPGETLEVKPGIPEALKEGLEDSLKGLGKWEGDTLVFTDPNGTRPYAPAELAGIITALNVDGTTNYQLAALQEWVALGANENALAEMRRKHAGEDVLDDFNRLIWRMQRATRILDAVELLAALAAAILTSL